MKLKENTTLKGGDYRIIRSLGKGGFGITYLALQAGLEREVVIKEFFMSYYCSREQDTLRVTLGTDGSREMIERFRDKFLKEARNIAKLRHQNIVSIHDVFEENGTAYYVMEYHAGGSLDSLLEHRVTLHENDALYYIRQIASALKYIHSRRMMHLDIKPDNILVDEDGNAVLIDFGLSKRYDNVGKATSTTPIGISHGYAPFEQYDPGGVSEFSPATDIYSLGATLFTLLTGDTPPRATMMPSSEYLSNELAAKGVSDSVTAAVVASMSFVKDNRPQSVDEFLALLDARAGGSRVTEPMRKKNNSRTTEPMNNGNNSDNNSGSHNSGDNKKPFNWKLPVAILAAILCIVFAGVGIKECNDYRAEQQRLAAIEQARQDSIATAVRAAQIAANEKRRNDSIANLPGKLYVTTTPVGAVVTVDGKRIGTTPINAYELKKGNYTVKITKEGYTGYSTNVAISSNEPANINTTLEASVVEKQQPQNNVKKSFNGKSVTFTVKGINFTMVAVAGGTFNMGSDDGGSDERPVHSVTLSDYYIGETEVTQELWQAVMGSNPSYFKGDKNPVECVSYKDCKKFIDKLNDLLAGQLPDGRKFRLPSEAQWEFAARGGNKSKGYKYSGSNNTDDVAWYWENENSDGRTHPVKQKQPNELGLYDMSGNVWEWCSDWYDSSYYSSSPLTNPEGPQVDKTYRVLRGGSWSSNARGCRVAFRRSSTPDRRCNDNGLRLAF